MANTSRIQETCEVTFVTVSDTQHGTQEWLPVVSFQGTWVLPPVDLLWKWLLYTFLNITWSFWYIITQNQIQIDHRIKQTQNPLPIFINFDLRVAKIEASFTNARLWEIK